MYEKLLVTPEFENYVMDSTNHVESCPVIIEMKLWTKEWIKERVLFIRTPLGESFNNLERFVHIAVNKGGMTINDSSILADNEILEEVKEKVVEELDKEIHAADMLIPLKEFICDSCGKKISVNGFPAIEYYPEININEAGNLEEHVKGLRIIHNHEYCAYSVEDKRQVFTMTIDNEFLLSDQLAELMALKEENTVDSLEFNEIVKRLTIPYYEEARLNMPETETVTSSFTLDWTIQKYNRHVLRSLVLYTHVR